MSLGRIGWSALAVAAAILVFQILAPPAIGLADNGDFAKITGRFNFYPAVDDLSDSAFRYINLQYDIRLDSHIDTGFHSSEELLIGAALLLNRVVSRPGVFDLRAMGVVHAALFLLALAFLIELLRGERARLRIALLALAVVVFCDVTFSAYYNSFYLDAGAFVFLMLSIVTVLRAVARRRPADTILALFFCLLLVTAKSQHALLAIPLAVFFIWERHAMWPRRALLGSALATACVLGGGAYELAEGSPPGYTGPCLFNIVFARLLPTAEDPAAELASLGLDQSYLRYMDMDAYMDRSPMRDRGWARSFPTKISFLRLGGFYVTHPGRALGVARLALGEAALGRPPGVGNYDQSAGRPPYAQSGAFSIWSTVRGRLLDVFLWAYPLLFAISVGAIAWRFPAGGVALGLMGLMEFALGAMTDASEVTRHLFLFNTIWDATLFAAVATLALSLRGRRRRPAGRYESELLEPTELVAGPGASHGTD
ncbi:MAG: hypothetical protein ABSH46_15285 [Bryobacteraceae bacterium]|jgi:hypothetical protein